MQNNRIYIFDARKATPEFPEIKRYCDSILPVIASHLKTTESLHIIVSGQNSLPGIIENIRISRHCIRAKPGSLKSAISLRRLLKTINPDICHSADETTFFPKRYRTLATIHKASPLSLPLNIYTLKQKIIYGIITQFKLKNLAGIIGISECILKTYPQQMLKNRSSIIHYGIAPEFKPQSQEVVDELKKRYNLPHKFMLIIAARSNILNLTTILDAFQSIDFTESSPIVIAGYASCSEKITKQIEHRRLTTRIQQIGEIDEKDMPALYSAAYALLFPDHIKGISLPVLESMACGTPVICSTLPALVEIAGGAATFVHLTDKLEWCRAINTALLSINWHAERSKCVLERAQKFSWEKAAEATLKLYRSL